MKTLLLITSILAIFAIFSSCSKDKTPVSNSSVVNINHNPTPFTFDLTGNWKDSTNVKYNYLIAYDSTKSKYLTNIQKVSDITGTATRITGIDKYTSTRSVRVTIDTLKLAISFDSDFAAAHVEHFSGLGKILSNNKFTLSVTSTLTDSLNPVLHTYTRL